MSSRLTDMALKLKFPKLPKLKLPVRKKKPAKAIAVDPIEAVNARITAITDVMAERIIKLELQNSSFIAEQANIIYRAACLRQRNDEQQELITELRQQFNTLYGQTTTNRHHTRTMGSILEDLHQSLSTKLIRLRQSDEDLVDFEHYDPAKATPEELSALIEHARILFRIDGADRYGNLEREKNSTAIVPAVYPPPAENTSSSPGCCTHNPAVTAKN